MATRIRLPRRLRSTLEGRPELLGSALTTLADFEPWLADNKLPFFPEYTDHGPDHITEVLTTADALISDEAWAHVTAEDGFVLVVSVLLHDCAMHLSEDGFVQLVAPKSPSDIIVPSIDKTTWHSLWISFLAEASRFDGKKLVGLFGDATPTRTPPSNPLDMNQRDRLLIGEFVRRHHPRLAHEIAIGGVPGPAHQRLRVNSPNPQLLNLAGLVARSHGQSLRNAVELLPHDERRESFQAHAPFLMAVLRIADYVQIQAERAPAKLLQVKSLKSPVSSTEWRKHHAIQTIHNHHEDPEALYVKAAPDSAPIFVGLRNLLDSIQGELDDVWAVLGEVYGRFESLKNLTINIRRVRSNIDNLEQFSKTISYLPRVIEFRTADSDLLKLLVKPLYGESNYAAGFRELIQNAIDACRERIDYERDSPLQNTYGATLDIRDVNGKCVITISDHGIGMTADIIQNYFLRAGASYRRSEEWANRHIDSSGHSRVLRTGRFGVGALAAFLIGPEITVSTRHVSESLGLHFSASIDSSNIDVVSVERPIGTTITIKSSVSISDMIHSHSTQRHAVNRRPWAWYALSNPPLTISAPMQGQEDSHDRKATFEPIPGPGGELHDGMHRISHPAFRDIQWWYPKGERSRGFSAFCNGIGIPEVTDSLAHSVDRELASKVDVDQWQHPLRLSGCIHPFTLSRPSLSIFDPDGNLPIDLTRDRISLAALPFSDALYDDILTEFISHAVATLPDSADETWTGGRQFGVNTSDWSWRPVFGSTRAGWIPLEPWSLSVLAPKRVLFTSSRSGSIDWASYDMHINVLRNRPNLRDVYDVLRALMRIDKRTHVCGALSLQSVSNAQVVVSSAILDKVSGRKRLPKTYPFKRVDVANGNVLLCVGGGEVSSPLVDVVPKRTLGDREIVAEWTMGKPVNADPSLTRLAQVWSQIVGVPEIPYNHDTRRALFARPGHVLAARLSRGMRSS